MDGAIFKTGEYFIKGAGQTMASEERAGTCTDGEQ